MSAKYRQTFKFDSHAIDAMRYALESLFGKVDSDGDIIMPGAFKKHFETKQDKFNRIFDVTDAEIIV